MGSSGGNSEEQNANRTVDSKDWAHEVLWENNPKGN